MRIRISSPGMLSRARGIGRAKSSLVATVRSPATAIAVLSLALAVIVPVARAAATGATGGDSGKSLESQVREFRLANGLRCLVVELTGRTSVA